MTDTLEYTVLIIFCFGIDIESVTRIREEGDDDEKQDAFYRSGLYLFDIIYDDSTAISTDCLYDIEGKLFCLGRLVERIFKSIFCHFSDLVHFGHIGSFKFRSIDDV